MPFDMPPASAGFPARGGWLVRAFTADLALVEPFRGGGIVGNFGFESARFTKLREIGQPEGRGGYGWGQWTADRRVTFLAYASDNNLDWRSDEANYGYALAELTGKIEGFDYRRSVSALMNTTTLEEAVFSFGQTFERPGGTTPDYLPGYESRLAIGQEAMEGYAALGGSAVVDLGSAVDKPGTPAPPASTHPTLGTTDALNDGVHLLQTLTTIAGYYSGPIDGHPNDELAAALKLYAGWLDRPKV